MDLQVKIPRNKVAMDITSVSGDLEVNNFEFADFEFRGTSSGAVVNNVKSDSFAFYAVSGDLKAENIETGEIVTETTSGDVSFNSLKSGFVNAKSVSGKVNLDYVELTNDMDIKNNVWWLLNLIFQLITSFVLILILLSGDLTN